MGWSEIDHNISQRQKRQKIHFLNLIRFKVVTAKKFFGKIVAYVTNDNVRFQLEI